MDTFPDWDAFKQALFREYPNAREPFISSADMEKFVDEKCQQEIHTLDEFTVFHWEFRRLANRLTKEKRFMPMVLTGHMKRAFILSSETKSYSISQTQRHLASKGRLSQSNMSGKGQSIYWKVLTTDTKHPDPR